MNQAPLRFGCIILAAGASTRMGSPKQLLPVGGSPLALRAADAALASAAWPVVVVVGAHAERIRSLFAQRPVLIAENATWSEGMASSIRTGVSTLTQFSRSLEGALLALCDQPGFSADTISKLVDAQRSSGLPIAASFYNGRLGAPALFLKSEFPALMALTGEQGARSLLNEESNRVARADLPELGIDLDTPQDYASYQSP